MKTKDIHASPHRQARIGIISWSVLLLVALAFCETGQSQVTNGLIHWWKADGDATDSVGGNNGTLVGDIAFTNGLFGQAFLCTGGYVSIPDSPSLSFDPLAPVTFSVWTYRTSAPYTFHIFAK
jgi:hypothetical protein